MQHNDEATAREEREGKQIITSKVNGSQLNNNNCY